MTTKHTSTAQSFASPLIGLVFLLYASGTLALTLWLSHIDHSSINEQTINASSFPPLPPIATNITPPNFVGMKDVKVKKQQFFDFLLPMIRSRNDAIIAQRQWLQDQASKLAKGEPIDTKVLHSLAERYKVSATSNKQLINALLKRIDIIPASLVLAQAAKESGWGTSRFARQANNYFGHWCYTKGCGLVPSSRDNSASHEVRKFISVDESVAAYFYNINTNRSYKPLREIRAEQRKESKTLTGTKLAEGLIRYSSRGQKYVTEIQGLIKQNKLSKYNRPL